MAAVTIQSYWRGYNCRRRLRALRHGTLIKTARESVRRELGAVIIQKMFRGMKARQEARERRCAIVVIQKDWRMHMVCRGWKRRLRQWRWENEAAIVLQSCIRGYLARLKRKRLKYEDEDKFSFQEDNCLLTEDKTPQGERRGCHADAPEDSSDERSYESKGDTAKEQVAGHLTDPALSAGEGGVEEGPRQSPVLEEGLNKISLSSSLIILSPPEPASSSPSDPSLRPSNPSPNIKPTSTLEPTRSQKQLRPLKSMPRLPSTTSYSGPSPTKQATQKSPIATGPALASHSSSRIKTTSISETIAAARNEAGLARTSLPNSRLHALHSSFKK